MKNIRQSTISLALAASLITVLVGLLATSGRSILASEQAGATLYVAPGGTCGGATPCYASLQAAIDAASAGDEIRVAAGTYAGTQTRVFTQFGSPFTATQVALITKSLSLYGGYSTSNWTTTDPTGNPTIIDAQRNGRGVTIVGTGSQTMTVEGFTLTGGDYTGLGNASGQFVVCVRTSSDCGGGLFAYAAKVILRTLVISDNVAHRDGVSGYGDGGGLYLWETSTGSLIENTIVFSNAALGSGGTGGGGRVTFGGGLTISTSAFIRNSASGEGGGLQVFQPNGTLAIEQTDFLSNTAANSDGGALETRITFDGTAVRLNRVRIIDNAAWGQGSALQIVAQGLGVVRVELTNVVMALNRLAIPGTTGSVVNGGSGNSKALDLHMAHVTIADNPVPGALRLDTLSGQPATATLTNTLVVSTPAGLIGSQTSGPLVIRHTNTLTWMVSTLHTTEAGSPTFAATGTTTGDPKLDATYHLQMGSAAINAGTDAGVITDIDGDLRPGLPDIGADEFVMKVYLPVVLRNN